MREKMIAIAKRLRIRAAAMTDADPHLMTPKDILNCIAAEIEEELEAERLPNPPIIVTDESKGTTR